MKAWLIAIALTGCGGDDLDSNPQLSGTLQAVGGTLGSWTFTPTRCRYGDGQFFIGADLTDGAIDVRLIEDPTDGYVVTVALDNDPATPTAQFSARVCTQLQAAIDTHRTGSFSLDCPTAGGGEISGALDYADCGGSF